MTTSVVLLRGVNLGARNRIPMADLRALLERVGCTAVRTHLQSGNAVVASRRSPAVLEKAVAAALVGHGLPVAAMVRTADELARVVRDCPWEGLDPKRFQVGFLSGEPDPAAVQAIEHQALLPERVVVGERVLYLDQGPGIRNSKLNGLRLGVDMTARNWRTVLALHELASGQVPGGEFSEVLRRRRMVRHCTGPRSWPFVPTRATQTPTMQDAPLVVVPLTHESAYVDRCAKPDKGAAGVQERPVPFWYVDTGMAALRMLLSAVDEGLGASRFGIQAEHRAGFKADVGVPDAHEPVVAPPSAAAGAARTPSAA